jgi:hypothetical protein
MEERDRPSFRFLDTPNAHRKKGQSRFPFFLLLSFGLGCFEEGYTTDQVKGGGRRSGQVSRR